MPVLSPLLACEPRKVEIMSLSALEGTGQTLVQDRRLCFLSA